MKEKILLIGKLALVGLFIFVIFKSCVKTIINFEEPAIYQTVYEDGRINKVFIVPPNEIILQKKIGDYFESGLFHVVGSNASHYFGPLYNVGNSPLGLRLYNDAEEVWNTEFTLKATKGNIEPSTFSSIGSSYFNRIIIYPNSITINGQNYQKINLDLDELKKQEALFK